MSLLVVLLVCVSNSLCESRTNLEEEFKDTGGAAVVLDVGSGRLFSSYGAIDEIKASPGSTLKPSVLKAALDAGLIDERATAYCNGPLLVHGHNLACVHPRQVTILDARQALANSCNSYFAMVARRMDAVVLLSSLREYGLMPSTSPQTPDERVLLALGVEGILVSPRQLAVAYRKLALALEQQTKAAIAVKDGLLTSVETGMAHAAEVPGMVIAGKTGTAPDAISPQGHGWFAGIVYEGGIPKRVVVIYLPGGNGSDAARLARRVLLEWRSEP